LIRVVFADLSCRTTTVQAIPDSPAQWRSPTFLWSSSGTWDETVKLRIGIG
jgi:hypothetical protein